MRLSLLGTGNAGGMPVYGCRCPHCEAARLDVTLQRGPACAVLTLGQRHYLLDAGLMDIATRFPAGSLSGIFLTHFHVDHVQGLFHLRWGRDMRIPVYCPPDSEGCADLFKHPGILDFQVQKKFAAFELHGLQVTPLPLIHSKVTFGYGLDYAGQRLAYLTDTKGLPPKTLAWLGERPLDLLVIDTSHPPGVDNAGHNNLSETVALHRQLNVKRTVLTHIGHELDGWLRQHRAELPDSILPGRDGETVFPFEAA